MTEITLLGINVCPQNCRMTAKKDSSQVLQQVKIFLCTKIHLFQLSKEKKKGEATLERAGSNTVLILVSLRHEQCWGRAQPHSSVILLVSQLALPKLPKDRQGGHFHANCSAPFSDGLRVLWTAQFFKEQMENCQVNGEVFCVLIIAHKTPLSVPKAGSHTVVTKLL